MTNDVGAPRHPTKCQVAFQALVNTDPSASSSSSSSSHAHTSILITQTCWNEARLCVVVYEAKRYGERHKSMHTQARLLLWLRIVN